MHVNQKFPLLIGSTLLCLLSGLKAETNGMTEFLKSKYGFFVHYVWGGSQEKPFTCDRHGKRPATFDELAAAFDAPGFASDLEKWGVEYVIFTAWHYNINPLFPSETMKKWGMENHTCKRDLIRDVITACKAKGIKVMLYTHPRDGHDLSLEDQLKTGWGGPNSHDPKWENFDRKKWNDFTNELYQELIARYGNDIIGIFSDEGSPAGDSYRVIDYPRLRRTVKALQPDLMMEQNFYGTTYSLDVGCKEYSYWGEFANRDGNAWPAWRVPVATTFAPAWYATRPAGEHVAAFKPEDMFRYTSLQAGANHEGGGVQWAAGNYAGGGWETGVDEAMSRIAGYMKPIAPSIKNVYASTSWPTAQGTKLPDLKWGVATRATDDSVEYLHILNPPANGARFLTLPLPADGKRFSKAVLLAGGKPVALKQDETGVHVKLPDGVNWDKLVTVIALEVADDSPLQNLALWKAFRGSSFPDPTPQGGSAYAFHAVDGDPSTAWNSRPDGQTEGNEPVPADPKPSCQVDLGKAANISRVEVLGQIGENVALQISNTADFSEATTLATSQATKLDTLEIRKATYGKGTQYADVTDKVRQAVSDGGLQIKADNSLSGGDPAPNVAKELRVEFTLNGEDRTAIVAEEQFFLNIGISKPWTIEAPAGTSARYVRLIRTQDGPPLSVAELRIFGTFE